MEEQSKDVDADAERDSWWCVQCQKRPGLEVKRLETIIQQAKQSDLPIEWDEIEAGAMRLPDRLRNTKLASESGDLFRDHAPQFPSQPQEPILVPNHQADGRTRFSIEDTFAHKEESHTRDDFSNIGSDSAETKSVDWSVVSEEISHLKMAPHLESKCMHAHLSLI